MAEIGGVNINLPKVDVAGFMGKLGQFAQILLIVGVIGFIVFLIFYTKKQKQIYKYKVHIFEEVRGKFIRVKSDLARELTVPDTNVAVFFLKDSKIYLPRPIRNMGLNEYWFVIRNNREWINIELANFNELTKELGYEFDYTDTRYAYVNLKEIIKRNYRDKVAKWWEKYQGLIYMVVLLLAFALAMGYVTTKVGKAVTGMTEIQKEQTKQLEIQNDIMKAYNTLYEKIYNSKYTFTYPNGTVGTG